MPRGSATRHSPSPPKQPSFKPKHFRVRSSDCGGAKLSWGLRPYAEAKRAEPAPALNTLLLDLEGSHAPQQRTLLWQAQYYTRTSHLQTCHWPTATQEDWLRIHWLNYENTLPT